MAETESVTENYRPKEINHFRVRVKTCGKSARIIRATRLWDKPCGLKCHVHFNSFDHSDGIRYLAARWNMQIIEGGRQLESRQQCPAQINDRYPVLLRDNRIRLIHHRCTFLFLIIDPLLTGIVSTKNQVRTRPKWQPDKSKNKSRKGSSGFCFLLSG